MATYKVAGPDGKIHKFQGPDGASEQQVIAFAEKHFGSGQKLRARLPDDEIPTPPDPTGTNTENFLAGVGRPVDRLLDGLTQLYLKARGEDSANRALEAKIAEKRQNDKPLIDTKAGVAGELTGITAMTAVPVARVLRMSAGMARGLPAAGRLAASLGTSAGVGAGISATDPTVGDESRAGNAAEGAAWGLAGDVSGRVLGRAIRGAVMMSPAARSLPPEVRDAATIGQLADPNTTSGRAVSNVEEAATSIPIYGALIRNARQRGVDAWRDNTLQRAAPEGYQVPRGGSTRERVGNMYEEFQRQYNNELQGQTIAPSRQFEQEALRLIRDPRNGLTAAEQDAVERAVMSNYTDMFGAQPQMAPAGTTLTAQQLGTAVGASGDRAKRLEAYLAQRARDYSREQGVKAGDHARLFSGLEEAWSDAYRAQLPQNVQNNIARIDRQYAPYKTIERAAGALGNTEGNFTPAQLANSVKARTGAGRFGRGEGLLAQEAQAGKAVFQDRMPNSGTTDRAATMGALTGGAALLDPTSTAIGLGAIAAGTTRTGKNILTGNTRTQALLRRLRMDDVADQYGPQFGISIGNADTE